MQLAMEKVLYPAVPTSAEPADSRLNISVIFTTVEATLSALRTAAALAGGWKAHITVVVPQIVPYPLSLTNPPVQADFNERRFRVLASRSPVATTVRLYLCRDREETLASVLPPRSLVVVGGCTHWWPTAESRLVKALRRAGHEVIVARAE